LLSASEVEYNWIEALSFHSGDSAVQLKQVVEPFGEVNVYPKGSRKRVVATILMEPHREGCQTGVALDGSGSMSKLYGVDGGSRVLSPLFGGPKKLNNEVTPVAQQICAYLARKFDADGGTTCIYWATGSGGSEVEVVGDFTAEKAERHTFGAPRDLGTGTQLLPAVKYFVERFKTAPFGFYVFVTDGELHDLEDVKDYSKRLAREIAAKRRNPVKFVLIGLGESVNESQMEDLDDLDTGTDVDLWDHKLAAEMRQLAEIFAEVVDRNARVADHGKILDANGRIVRDYSDRGLPAYLDFEVDANADSFVLEVNGQRVTQPLSDNMRVSAVSSQTPIVGAPVVPVAPAPKQIDPNEPVELSAEDVIAEDPTASEWKDLPLAFGKDVADPDAPDVGLEEAKDE